MLVLSPSLGKGIYVKREPEVEEVGVDGYGFSSAGFYSYFSSCLSYYFSSSFGYSPAQNFFFLMIFYY